ncbi:MAG: hypothetical protein Q8908_11375 [Bacteroidota bacterium]|nr:hypothetical protein [Bacteroidota bacterium]
MMIDIKYCRTMLLFSFILFFGGYQLDAIKPKTKRSKPLEKLEKLVKDNERMISNEKKSISDINSDNKKSFAYKIKIQSGDYSLNIETNCLNDSLSPDEAGYTYPVTKQMLIFQYKNRILNSFNHPVVNCKRELKNGKKVEVLENEIIQMGILHGKNGVIYYVEGNSCNTCSEFEGFYSLKGETLWHNYTYYKTSDVQWIESVNNYNSMIKKYGIENRDIEMVCVLPIEKRNERFKTRIIKPVGGKWCQSPISARIR